MLNLWRWNKLDMVLGMKKLKIYWGILKKKQNTVQCYQWYDMEDKKSELTGWSMKDRRSRRGRNLGKRNIYKYQEISTHSSSEEQRWGWGCTRRCKWPGLRHSLKWLWNNLFFIKIILSWAFGMRLEFLIP